VPNIVTHELDNNHTHLITTNHKYHYFPKHYHETYSVALLTHGAKNFLVNGKNNTLDDTKIATMNPYEIHSGEAITEGGWNQLVILFDEHSTRKFATENELKRDEFIFENGVKEDLLFRNEVVNQCTNITNSCSDMEKEQSFQLLMGAIFRRENLMKNIRYMNVKGVRQAVSKMHDEPSVKHTLDELSSCAGMSKFHFLRSFKDATGMTPHAYLSVMRVERAKRLLMSSSKPIADIAADCGFADQAHLNRSYKKIYETTPGSIIRK